MEVNSLESLHPIVTPGVRRAVLVHVDKWRAGAEIPTDTQHLGVRTHVFLELENPTG
jgi:hypothetical protein